MTPLEYSQVRVIEQNGVPWFAGKDVAEILGYANPQKAIREHVDEEDKGVNEMDTPGGVQSVTTINESGLYSLILSSKLPTAKRFKKWITTEVIPSIRKHGAYMTEQTLEKALINPVFIDVYNYSSFRRFYVRLRRNSEKIYKQLQGVFGTHY